MDENNEDIGILNKPAKLSQEGVHQIISCLNGGSKEIHDLLIHECNIVYECKICKNLFRSLANFLVHKRGFCKEHCCEKMLLFENNDISHLNQSCFVQPASPKSSSEQASTVGANDYGSEDENNNVGLHLSPTKIYEKHSEFKTVNIGKCGEDKSGQWLDEIAVRAKYRLPDVSVRVKRIPTTKNAVMQAMYNDSQKLSDIEAIFKSSRKNSSANQFNRASSRNANSNLRNLRKTNYANSEAKSSPKTNCRLMEKPESTDSDVKKEIRFTPIELLKKRKDVDMVKKKCKLCDKVFKSLRELSRHMNNEHQEIRLLYSCTFCYRPFSKMYSVLMHIKNFHNKNEEEVEQLRVVIRKNSRFGKYDFKKQFLPDSVCSICGKAFSGPKAKGGHMRFCRSANGIKGNSGMASTKSKTIKTSFTASNIKATKKRNVYSANLKKCLISTYRIKAVNGIVSLDGNDIEAVRKKIDSLINSKENECLVCHKYFSSNMSVRRHVSKHLRLYRFSCNICKSKFYCKFDVGQHIKRQHADKITSQNDVFSFAKKL